MLPFEQARANFVAAARQGLRRPADVARRRGDPRRARLDVLLPLAAEGLDARASTAEDRDRYLGVIERRVTPAHRVAVDARLAQRDAQPGHAGQRLNSLTAAMVVRQRAGSPVAEWTPASLDEGGQWRHNFVTVEQLMTTDLVTVAEDDPVELAANLMDWHRIRQVLVEDDEHRLVGLVSYRAILRLLAHGADGGDVAVGEVMKREPVCVPPDMAPLRALELMRSFGIGALPVVVDGHLVGIVTEHDFMNVAGRLFYLLMGLLDGSQGRRRIQRNHPQS